MSGEKELLLSLPLDNKEREWMKERLRTLSVREEYQLAAAVWRSDRLSRLASQDRDERLESVLRQKPEDLAREAVNCLLSLEEYNVLCPAGSYESLGECYLKYYTDIPRKPGCLWIWSRSEKTMSPAIPVSLSATVMYPIPGRNRNNFIVEPIWSLFPKGTGACVSGWLLQQIRRGSGFVCRTTLP